MSNSIYGQLLRNPRKDRKLDLVRTAKRFRKLVAQPTFKSFTVFGDDLVAVERTPNVVRLNNLPAAGVTVLDTSKKAMLELYWRFKDQFQARMELLLTDTDSMFMEIQSEDLVADLRPLMDILDTSGLPTTHPLYDARFARVQGRLKIEYGAFNILEYAGVRSKVYALDLESAATGQAAVLKCKGVQKHALRKSVNFDDYKRCIFDGVTKGVKFNSIRTDGQHRLFTVEQSKTGLRNFDNKRFIEACGIKTRAFGYNPLVGNEVEDENAVSI